MCIVGVLARSGTRSAKPRIRWDGRMNAEVTTRFPWASPGAGWDGEAAAGSSLKDPLTGSSSHVGSHVVPFSASNVSWCPVPKLPNNDLDIRNYEILNG